MNKKDRTELLAIGWVLTILGGFMTVFLGLYLRKAWQLARILDTYNAQSHEVTWLAPAVAEFIRLLMYYLFPSLAGLILLSGLTILKVIRHEKCEAQLSERSRASTQPVTFSE